MDIFFGVYSSYHLVMFDIKPLLLEFALLSKKKDGHNTNAMK